MNQLIFGHDAEIARWVAERVPECGPDSFQSSAAIGVASCGRLIAGVVYHDFKPEFGTMELSMAAESPMWARRSTIYALLHYPFKQIGVYKLWTVTPADYTAALKVNAHIGFTREAILAHHFGRKRHAVINRMLRPDFTRLYETPNGKEVNVLTAPRA